MQRYLNLNGDSGVSAFEIGPQHLKVAFHDHAEYLYTYNSAGVLHIENMKNLALRGYGLNTYINTHVRKLYESKIK